MNDAFLFNNHSESGRAATHIQSRTDPLVPALG